MKLPDKSASTLTWFALILLVPGLMIQSPSGRFFFAALAGLVALVPLAFGSTKRRLYGGVIAALSLLIAAATYPEFSEDQDSYRDRVRQKSAQPAKQ
jgi:hypothetical protein